MEKSTSCFQLLENMVQLKLRLGRNDAGVETEGGVGGRGGGGAEGEGQVADPEAAAAP